MSTKTIAVRMKSNQREVRTVAQSVGAPNCRKFSSCNRREKDEGRCSLRKCPAYRAK